MEIFLSVNENIKNNLSNFLSFFLIIYEEYFKNKDKIDKKKRELEIVSMEVFVRRPFLSQCKGTIKHNKSQDSLTFPTYIPK